MSEPIAVLYADGHMADSAWAHRPINGDAEFSLQQIVDAALEHHVPVLGAGDLLDKAKVMSGPVTAMFGQLDRLHQSDLNLYYIRGQHEGESDFLSAHPAAVSLDQRGCLALPSNFTVQGIDYQPAGVLQKRLRSDLSVEKVPDILLLHQVWNEWMGSIACPQGSLAQIPLAPLVLTGDYHGDYLDEEHRCEDGHTVRVINPGSVCMQSITEPSDKYYAILYDDMRVEKVKLRTRPASIRHVIDSNQDMDLFVERAEDLIETLAASADQQQLPEHLRKPLIRVEYSVIVDSAKKRISRALKDRAHVFYKQRPVSRDNNSDLEVTGERKPGESVTLESRLGTWLEQQEKPHLLDKCQRLLQSDDTFTELTRMRDEYVNME